MLCRLCTAVLAPDLSVPVGKASSYKSCIWRCESCEVGYSNAREESSRQAIFARPEANVPDRLRSGLTEALAGACCRGARKSKPVSFCSLGSEDAVTWSVFGLLRELDALERLPRLAGVGDQASGPGSLLLWGHPVSGPLAPGLAAKLSAVSDAIGEDADWHTEPDVILAWPQLVLFAEAKTGSRNEQLAESETQKIDRYTGRADIFGAAPETVRELRYYELVRNWRIAADLADAAGMDTSVLVNLGPKRLRDDVLALRQVVGGRCRRLDHITWAELLRGLVFPDWFAGYAATRRLMEM